MFEFAMSDFEGDSMVVECDPRRSEHMARCLMYSGDTVPKDVNAVVAAIKANRAIHFASLVAREFQVRYRSPVSRGDASRRRDQQFNQHRRGRFARWPVQVLICGPSVPATCGCQRTRTQASKRA